ncbi:general odorant-binding protein 56a-like [Leptopilina heterotoma]|uniref:general odorant-binding protein 56a-like n=1 Tax=Leptopilina heterotoma TaxID=63436 RepID=UPI001CAA1843|nr:general odorant-binding protein 56a-like [Leptopilina heterotoma]
MNAILAILALCVVAVFADFKEEYDQHRAVCITESGVSPDAVKNAREGKIDENDNKLACFYSCLLKKFGIMTAEGTIDEEVARSKIPASIPKEKVDFVLTKCSGLKGQNECATGMKVMKCYLENKTFTLV